MAPWESALIGFPLVAAGIASIVWGIKRRLAWERGEDPPPERGYSFRACSRCLGSANTNQGWIEFPICARKYVKAAVAKGVG